MSRLSELIAELCPNGVEYKKLGEICEMVTDYTAAGSFADIAKNVQYMREMDFAQLIRTTDIKSGFSKDGRVYITESAYKYLWRVHLDEPSIILPNVGNCGEVYYLTPDELPKEKCALAPNALLIRSTKINLKFLYYWFCGVKFQKQLMKIVSPVGQGKFNKTELKKLSIPLPPLEIQREVVEILDKFAQLTAELTAELQKRKKQYEHYRDMLLNFTGGGRYDNISQNEPCPSIEWKRLGEIAEIMRGGNFQKKDFRESGVPCIHYGQIYTRFGIFADKTLTYIDSTVAAKQKFADSGDIVMAVTSENIDDVCKCLAWIGDEKVAVSGHSAIIKHNQNAKYLAYYFHTSDFAVQKRKLAHGTKVIEVTPSALANIEIPLPSLAEQERIVAILDRFDSLCNSLTEGLPAEIALRKKQYEYYRDKLLDFEKAG